MSSLFDTIIDNCKNVSIVRYHGHGAVILLMEIIIIIIFFYKTTRLKSSYWRRADTQHGLQPPHNEVAASLKNGMGLTAQWRGCTCTAPKTASSLETIFCIGIMHLRTWPLYNTYNHTNFLLRVLFIIARCGSCST